MQNETTTDRNHAQPKREIPPKPEPCAHCGALPSADEVHGSDGCRGAGGGELPRVGDPCGAEKGGGTIDRGGERCRQPFALLSGGVVGCPVHGMRRVAPPLEDEDEGAEGLAGGTWNGDPGELSAPVHDVEPAHLLAYLREARRFEVVGLLGRAPDDVLEDCAILARFDRGPVFQLVDNGGELNVSPLEERRPDHARGVGVDSIPTRWASGAFDAWEVLRALALSMQDQGEGVRGSGGDYCARVGGFPLPWGSSPLDDEPSEGGGRPGTPSDSAPGEHPDRPCDPGCSRRFSPAAECDCSRSETAPGDSPAGCA